MQKKITLGVESEGLPLQLTQLINSVEFTNVTKYLMTFNQKQINCNQRLNKLNQLNASLFSSITKRCLTTMNIHIPE